MLYHVLIVFFLFVSCILSVTIPVIDISALLQENIDESVKQITVNEIGQAARYVGFFYIYNHNVSVALQAKLVDQSKSFFTCATMEEKGKISMANGGKAWRGYFEVGDELTSGVPDNKEGIYLGVHLPNDTSDDPLHGSNLYPKFNDCMVGDDNDFDTSIDMTTSIDEYMNEMKKLGQVILYALIKSLNISSSVFPDIDSIYSWKNPTELFRIFNYPPHNNRTLHEDSVGVGKHTDYGYITILKQDNSGGLQIELNGDQWIDAVPIINTFIINIGDALERITGALFLATPHRVIQRRDTTLDRLSFPYFFDPPFHNHMRQMYEYLNDNDKALALHHQEKLKGNNRYNHEILTGDYGQYLVNKVSRVFPQLAKKEIHGSSRSVSKSEL